MDGDTPVVATKTEEPTPVDLALAAWSESQERLAEVLADGGLDALDDLSLVEVLRRVERTRSRSALLDHHLIAEGLARRLPDTVTQPSMTGVLVWALRLSRGEAARRVRAAGQLGRRRSMTGTALAPLRPSLATAQTTGDLTPEQVDVCLRALDAVDRRGFDSADVDAAEATLAQFASVFPPAELRGLCQQVVDRIDPDGTLPDDELHRDRRHLELRRCRDHSWCLDGRLTPDLGAKLNAVLSPLAAPRPSTTVTADARQIEEPDPRHHGQRQHDALEDVCDRLLRSGTLPESGGTPATVILTIDEHDLVTQQRWGVAADGTPLATSTMGRVADQAEVVPTVIGSEGVVLRMGRTRRIATPGQTLALVVRDRGCSFPGCERPPEWCQRHHVVAWVDGGRTDLDNLTLVCAYHHHNFEARGWTCRMIDGLPTWAPPHWIDPQQRPLRNSRISAANLKITIKAADRHIAAAAGPPVLQC